MSRNRHAKKTCYMCDQPATSKEHFPPRCFFPDSMRDNLYTVPSCEVHNSNRSKDDEYFLLMIYSHFGNDQQMQLEGARWATRAVRNNPRLRSFFQNARPVGESLIAFDVDEARINNEIEHIARAAYYYEFHEKWPHSINVICTGLLSDPMIDGVSALEKNKLVGQLSSASEEYLSGQPRKGSNPKIFYYQLERNVDEMMLFIRMVFYGGMTAFVYSTQAAKENS